jgi:aminoglycoside 6'-N-acetyltransferase
MFQVDSRVMQVFAHGSTVAHAPSCRRVILRGPHFPKHWLYAREVSVDVYRFRPFDRADLTTAERWLQTPEVVRWWGDPAHELTLLTEDLVQPLMDQWIVEFDGMPFAYAQAYCVHSWPQKHLEHLPADARAIDALIGVPEMLSKGHGGRFLRQLAMMLVEQGAPLVAIDPDADNLRARRAYARAGFKAEAILRAADGPVALMIFRP